MSEGRVAFLIPVDRVNWGEQVGVGNQGTLSNRCGRFAFTCAVVSLLVVAFGAAAGARQISANPETPKAGAPRPADPLTASGFDRF